MNRDKRDESAAEEKMRDVAAKLDEAAESFAGTSDIESHARVGYTEPNVEARAQSAADAEGVTLHRNPNGSHAAIDESRADERPQASTADGSGHRSDGNGSDDPADAEDELSTADVVKILRRATSVMLATALDDGTILAHPMSPLQVTDEADVWFFLALDGDQTRALRTNQAVNISVAEAGNWLSVAGRVEFVDDQDKIDALWSDAATVWFDDPHDHNLGLIKVTSETAQHWGRPGGKVSGLFQLVKSRITGGRPAGGTHTAEL